MLHNTSAFLIISLFDYKPEFDQIIQVHSLFCEVIVITLHDWKKCIDNHNFKKETNLEILLFKARNKPEA